MRTAILGIGTAVPPRAYNSDEVFELAGYGRQAIRSIFRNSGIDRRHLALEAGHRIQNDPQWFSDHYATWAPRLAEQAALDALREARVEAAKIDYLVVTSCTGYVCPGLSQILARRLGLGSRAKTANLVGMGCNAAIPALERAVEFTGLHPGSTALVVSAEVCSATYWIDENDLESAVGNAIFADGAAAAVIGAAHASADDAGAPRFRAFASRADREHIGHMGFHNEQGRLRVLLSREVPDLVAPLCDEVVKELLDGVRASEISWVVHPGGRKILELLSSRWGASRNLESSWKVLANYGNMSSATIFFVLREELARARRGPVVLLAMGPGLSVEGALLEL